MPSMSQMTSGKCFNGEGSAQESHENMKRVLQEHAKGTQGVLTAFSRQALSPKAVSGSAWILRSLCRAPCTVSTDRHKAVLSERTAPVWKAAALITADKNKLVCPTQWSANHGS